VSQLRKNRLVSSVSAIGMLIILESLGFEPRTSGDVTFIFLSTPSPNCNKPFNEIRRKNEATAIFSGSLDSYGVFLCRCVVHACGV